MKILKWKSPNSLHQSKPISDIYDDCELHKPIKRSFLIIIIILLKYKRALRHTDTNICSSPPNNKKVFHIIIYLFLDCYIFYVTF